MTSQSPGAQADENQFEKVVFEILLGFAGYAQTNEFGSGPPIEKIGQGDLCIFRRCECGERSQGERKRGRARKRAG